MKVEKLQVKDNSSIKILLFSFFGLPVVFGVFSLSFNYLIGFIITCAIYTCFVFVYFKVYSKSEEEYAISADSETITFIKFGTYYWDQIDKIDWFKDRSLIVTTYKDWYLRIYLKDGTQLNIKTNNFDTFGEELAYKLSQLGQLDYQAKKLE
jgi:hypothetical protein